MSIRALRWRIALLCSFASVTAVLCLGIAALAQAASFGPESFDGAIAADEAGEAAFSQAGGHPYSYSTTIHFNLDPSSKEGTLWPAEPVKDVIADVPPGFVGMPAGIPQCSLQELVGIPDNSYEPECPSDSQLGVASLRASACPEACVELPFANIFRKPARL